MRRSALQAALGLTLLIAFWGRTAWAVDGENERQTLRGLAGVHVYVEPFSENAKRAGYDERMFLTDAELKLRMAGIKVLSKDEMLATGGAGLYLNVNALAERSGENAVYSIHPSVHQLVRLKREPSSLYIADTWRVGGAGSGRVSDVRAAAKDHVGKFINAWLSVNPRD